MTTKTRDSSKRARRAALVPTLGPAVAHFIEENLVHAEGDYFGKPFILRPWQKRFIYRAYELNPDGSRRYNRVILGVGKGNGKTELAAAIACAELAGPVLCVGWKNGRPLAAPRVAPDIPVAAASFEQANLVFGAAAAMIKNGKLAPHFDVFETEILPKYGPGRMYRVAAVAGTNDGRRPTFFVADELHEWTGNKERVHLVLSNGRAKRKDAWQLGISTAGWDLSSLLGRLYLHGKRVVAGEINDPSLLFMWYEPSGEVADLGDIPALTRALREANPAAGDFLSLETLIARSREMPEYEFRRYHLNQWVAAPEQWIPLTDWDACARVRTVPEGTPIVIGFDGSYSRDSTAIVGCTLDGHVFVINAWEKPVDAGDDWRVDILAVEEALRDACARWQVRIIGCDPFRWQRTIAVLKEAGLPVVEWASHLPSKMVPACTVFYDAVKQKRLSHDGDPRLRNHLAHCVVKIDSRGPRITKDHKDSARRIDLAVAAVIAYELHLEAKEQQPGGWRPI